MGSKANNCNLNRVDLYNPDVFHSVSPIIIPFFFLANLNPRK